MKHITIEITGDRDARDEIAETIARILALESTIIGVYPTFFSRRTHGKEPKLEIQVRSNS